MKYCFRRNNYFLLAGALIAVILYICCVCFIMRADLNVGFWMFLWAATLLYSIPAAYFLWSGLEIHTYALLQKDGIHLISRKSGELGLLPWDIFVDCSWGPRGAERKGETYMVLLTRWDVALHGKPANCYRGKLTKQEVQAYRLDEAMDAIAQGIMTVENLKNRPMLLIAAEQKQYDAWRSLWRAAVKGQRAD